MVRKHLLGFFINTGTSQTPVWVRYTKGTELTISANPEVETFDYVADEMPTDELRYYKMQLDQDLVMIEGDAMFNEVYDRFVTRAVGASAKAEFLVVFMWDFEVGTPTVFTAWRCTEGLLVINDVNMVDSKINCSCYFGGAITDGTATVTAGVPVFTAAT